MKVAICTSGIYENKHRFVEITNELKKTYCKKNGIGFLFCDQTTDNNRRNTWSRFSLLLQAFDAGADWAVWMDADVAPLNHDFNLVDFLSEIPNDKIVINRNVKGFDCAVFAVPKTDRMIEWLLCMDSEETFNKYKSTALQEKSAIEDSLFVDMYQTVQENVGWCCYEDIYSRPDLQIFEFGKHWCLHIPHMGDNYRESRFRYYSLKLSSEPCPICGQSSFAYMNIPFDSTAEKITHGLKPIGGEVCYHKCPECDFIFAPYFSQWSDEDYKEKIYNNDYGHLLLYSLENGERTKQLMELFGNFIANEQPRHLDYGAYDGSFSQALQRQYHISTEYYDKYKAQSDNALKGKYSLITCFDTVSCVYDQNGLFSHFNSLLLDGGCLMISTLLWDKNMATRYTMPCDWNFVAPRQGNICFHSQESLRRISSANGFLITSESNDEIQIFQKVTSIK